MTLQQYQIFDFPPNWADAISVKYRFDTALFASEHYREQRKALKALPCIDMSFNVLADTRAPEIWDWLRASLNAPLYVPMWTEPLIPAAATGGPWTSVVTQDFSGCYYFNNLTRFVIFIDRTQATAPQLATLGAISGTTGFAVGANTWTAPLANTIIYPAFAGHTRHDNAERRNRDRGKPET